MNSFLKVAKEYLQNYLNWFLLPKKTQQIEVQR